MAEWEMEFRVPVEWQGEGTMLVRGFAPVEDDDNDRIEPTDSERAAALADAKRNFDSDKLNDFTFAGTNGYTTVDDGTVALHSAKWDKAERVD